MFDYQIYQCFADLRSMILDWSLVHASEFPHVSDLDLCQSRMY